MKRFFILAVTLISVFAVLVSTHAEASDDIKFDISVFENSEKYNVEFDEMNDTGEISLTDGLLIVGANESNSDDILLGEIDIKIVEDQPPVLRLALIFRGEDWVFTDKVILKPADTRYTFDVECDTDVDDGKVYELCMIAFSEESVQMLQDIIDNQVLIVKCRLEGSDRDADFNLVFDVDQVKTILDDYRASGALENDFSMIKKMFPCKIK